MDSRKRAKAGRFLHALLRSTSALGGALVLLGCDGGSESGAIPPIQAVRIPPVIASLPTQPELPKLPIASGDCSAVVSIVHGPSDLANVAPKELPAVKEYVDKNGCVNARRLYFFDVQERVVREELVLFVAEWMDVQEQAYRSPDTENYVVTTSYNDADRTATEQTDSGDNGTVEREVITTLDAQGRVVREEFLNHEGTNSERQVRTTEFNAAGLVARTTELSAGQLSEYVWTYDAGGRETSRVLIANGVERNRIETTYSAQGEIVTRTETSPNALTHDVYLRNSEGKVLRHDHTLSRASGPLPNESSTSIYLYGTNGALTSSRREWRTGGKITAVWNSSYDSRGNETLAEQDKDGNGTVDTTTVTEYDATGRQTLREINHLGKLWTRSETKFDAEGRIAERTNMRPMGNTMDTPDGERLVYTYGANGLVSRTELFDLKGNLRSAVESAYDAAGREIESRHFDSGNRLLKLSGRAYDSADRTTRTWEDRNADGKIDAQTVSTFDAAGNRLFAGEDYDGNGLYDHARIWKF